jgi:hypothetical protein
MTSTPHTQQWRATLIVHDRDLAGDRLDAEVSLTVEVPVTGNRREAAGAAARAAFRAAGFGPVMDRPEARVTVTVSAA